jgi:hypothetical protein
MAGAASPPVTPMRTPPAMTPAPVAMRYQQYFAPDQKKACVEFLSEAERK